MCVGVLTSGSSIARETDGDTEEGCGLAKMSCLCSLSLNELYGMLLFTKCSVKGHSQKSINVN